MAFEKQDHLLDCRDAGSIPNSREIDSVVGKLDQLATIRGLQARRFPYERILLGYKRGRGELRISALGKAERVRWASGESCPHARLASSTKRLLTRGTKGSKSSLAK
jgi:hypothetical protein